MAEPIVWESDLGKALTRALTEKKPVLLDFFNPNWIGCKRMGAVTYPEAAVIDFVNNSLIPLQIIAGTQPWSTDFNVKWTPTLITLDAQGKEHHRTLGFLGAQDLIASQLLGIAKVYFDEDKPEEALPKLDKLLTDYPQSAAAPEAIYLRGVCRYKSTKVAKHLKEAWEKLKADYPQSEWTMRAEPYEAL